MRHLSLRARLTLMLGLLCCVSLAATLFLAVILPSRLNTLTNSFAVARGNDIGVQLATSLSPYMASADDANVAAVLKNLSQISGVHYAVILRPDGKVLTRWHGERVPLAALEQQSHAGADLIDGKLQVVQDIEWDGRLVGSLVMAVDISAVQEHVDALCLQALLVAIVFFPVCIGLILYTIAIFARPIGQLSAMTARIVQTGDLTRTVEMLRSDELGILATSVGAIIEQQRTILARINGLIVGITAVAERVFVAGHGVSTGATHIQARVTDTAAAARDMLTVIEVIGRDVASLADTSNKSAVSLGQMTTSNAAMASVMETMTNSTRSTGDAIEGMARSITEIAHNIERLNDTILQTTSSVGAMTQNIEDVERTIRETARLSERVSTDAEVGVIALQKTLEGIDNIKHASQSAADVIAHLGLRIDEIGAILRVIDEVAAQTKLLSLNAAIIASQAGEHGRGFSVVADQIKQLAQRTGASTREIAGLIQSVQEESRNAVSAMALGVTSVDTGVLLGHEAADALEKIRQSAGASTAMIHKIATAAIDQARGSKEISQSIGRIGQTVAQISSYSQQQAHGTEQITSSSKNMQALTEQIRQATVEQSKNADQIVNAMQNINGMLSRLGAAQRTQAQSASRVQTSVEEIRSISMTQSTSVAELEAAIGSLSEEAKGLAVEVRRYKL
jgi:methyl-accepting chemotaxis protein